MLHSLIDATGTSRRRVSLFSRHAIALLALLPMLSVTGCGRPPAQPQLVTLTLASGPLGGGFYPLGESFARALTRSMSNVRIRARPSAGAISNVEAIEAGQADLALTFADVAYVAFVGRLDRARIPSEEMRAVAVLQLTPVHLVAGALSHIRTVRDLTGKRISTGPPGSGTALTARLILEAFGVDPDHVHVEGLGFDAAAARLRGGTLDAMFDDGDYPVDSVRAAITGGARLIPIVGAPVDSLRRDYPFLRLAFIPRYTYPKQNAPIHTIGVDTILVCRRSLPESLVYSLTKHLFIALPALAERQSSLRSMVIDQAPATPIPLHDGAARYYRERELSQ